MPTRAEAQSKTSVDVTDEQADLEMAAAFAAWYTQEYAVSPWNAWLAACAWQREQDAQARAVDAHIGGTEDNAPGTGKDTG